MIRGHGAMGPTLAEFGWSVLLTLLSPSDIPQTLDGHTRLNLDSPQCQTGVESCCTARDWGHFTAMKALNPHLSITRKWI